MIPGMVLVVRFSVAVAQCQSTVSRVIPHVISQLHRCTIPSVDNPPPDVGTTQEVVETAVDDPSWSFVLACSVNRFFCFSAHSRLACRPRSAASARAFRVASSFSFLSFSSLSFSTLERAKTSLPFAFWRTASSLDTLSFCPAASWTEDTRGLEFIGRSITLMVRRTLELAFATSGLGLEMSIEDGRGLGPA